MVDHKVTGKNIQVLREKAGYTQASLAKFLHVDQSLVSKIEKGERALTTDSLEKLSGLFGVTTEELTHENVSPCNLSFAFRGSDFTIEEMEAISDINRIALNSEFMSKLLKEEKHA